MATATRSRKGRSHATLHLHKPAGMISARVQAVGPERFGIVSVDCAKARSKWMLADFCGRVLVPPTIVEHTRPGLQQAVELVRRAAKEQGLQEVLVSVERTGDYHRPVQRAFAAAGFETRVVHPFVVSAGELAGEMGPIAHYANANAITGQAGLFPSRHQSDAVDRQGKIVRSANKRLRTALLRVADNLLSVNSYFKGQRALWGSKRVDPRLQRTRVAKRFSRLAYAMVAGTQIVAHDCCRLPGYVLDKLVMFHLEHAAPAEALQAALDAAAGQIPVAARGRESEALQQRVAQSRTARKPGLKPLGALLGELLAKRLGVHVQSTPEA